MPVVRDEHSGNLDLANLLQTTKTQSQQHKNYRLLPPASCLCVFVVTFLQSNYFADGDAEGFGDAGAVEGFLTVVPP
jgi:hypothetical protein